jgi:hypothetical protein
MTPAMQRLAGELEVGARYVITKNCESEGAVFGTLDRINGQVLTFSSILHDESTPLTLGQKSLIVVHITQLRDLRRLFQ